jgi:hypothetical protein
MRIAEARAPKVAPRESIATVVTVVVTVEIIDINVRLFMCGNL